MLQFAKATYNTNKLNLQCLRVGFGGRCLDQQKAPKPIKGFGIYVITDIDAEFHID
jgi:hypothetical protein